MLRRIAGRTERTKDLLDPRCLPPWRGKVGRTDIVTKFDNVERNIKTALPRSFNCCLFFIRVRGVRGGTGVCPSCPRMERRNLPWTVSKYRTSLVTPVNLACMALEGGRKLEYLAQTYTCAGRTWQKKNMGAIPQPAIKPGTEELSEQTTAVTCCLLWQLLNICYF